MHTSLYTVTVPQFIKSLTNLSAFIDKAVMHIEGNGVDPETLLNARLADDQFPFVRQVQLASDTAKAFPARLNGEEPVSMPDTEKTMGELKIRIDRTIEILKGIHPVDIDGKEDVSVTMKWFPMPLTGFSYAYEYTVPNFYFHMATAYAILRHNGVDLGKADFLGQLTFSEKI